MQKIMHGHGKKTLPLHIPSFFVLQNVVQRRTKLKWMLLRWYYSKATRSYSWLNIIGIFRIMGISKLEWIVSATIQCNKMKQKGSYVRDFRVTQV